MKKKNLTRLILFILIIVAICAFIWEYTKPANITVKGIKGAQAILVKTVHLQIKDMPVTIQELASVEAEQSVNVISQVSGTLKKIHINEGQDVHAGELLFEIDASVYATDVAQAQATLERDQAQLTYLKSNANRYKTLAKLEYVTQQQYEEAEASMREQEAVVAGDQALLQQKKIQLSYTQIRAPISGKAGVINFHMGDLIPANGATPLVVINRLDHVLVDFNIPQSRLSELLKYENAGTLKIQVLDENGSTLLAQGNLAFIGNVISSQTGTVQVKGEVDNQKLALWPGELVTVKLILSTEHNAMVIPSISVQLGQKGNYVYLVKNKKAVIQTIQVSRVMNGETVVAGGLKPEDDIILEIPPGLQEGSAVQVEGAEKNKVKGQKKKP